MERTTRTIATAGRTAALAALIAPSPAAAYHESLGMGGGSALHVFVLIAVVVAVMLFLLSRWQPKKQGRKRSGMSPRSAGRKGKRRS